MKSYTLRPDTFTLKFNFTHTDWSLKSIVTGPTGEYITPHDSDVNHSCPGYLTHASRASRHLNTHFPVVVCGWWQSQW